LWWARQDLNLGLLPPSSQSWPGSRVRCAGAWRAARGEGERVDVLLTLLEALGGEPA